MNKNLKTTILLFLALFAIPFLYGEESLSKYSYFKEYDYSLEQLQDLNFDTIYLVAASPTSDNLGSLGAHAFIILSKGDNLTDAIAINYYAYYETLSHFSKSIKGATVGLPGYIDIRPFNELTERYTLGQNRTLLLYKTNLDKSYIPLILDVVFQLKKYDLKYQFFAYNCSSLLGDVFSQVLNIDEEKYYFPHVIMPARLVSLFKNYGLIESEKVISPPLVKLLNKENTLSEYDIFSRYNFFNVHHSETTQADGFSKFYVTEDNFESNTIFSEKVSNLYLGMDNLNFNFGFTFFSNEYNQQRQSALVLYDFDLLDINFNINNGLKLNDFILVEKGRYPKSNYTTFDPASYFIMKYNKNNSSFDINGGYGISFGSLKSIIYIIPTIETNLSDLDITLRLKALICYYQPNFYVSLNFDYPIYNKTINSEQDLELKVGYDFYKDLSIEGSYDILDNEFNILLNYKFYPFIK